MKTMNTCAACNDYLPEGQTRGLRVVRRESPFCDDCLSGHTKPRLEDRINRFRVVLDRMVAANEILSREPLSVEGVTMREDLLRLGFTEPIADFAISDYAGTGRPYYDAIEVESTHVDLQRSEEALALFNSRTASLTIPSHGR